MNISISPSLSFPPGTTEEQKERARRVHALAQRIQVEYGIDLASYLLGLEDRIAALEKALHEKGH